MPAISVLVTTFNRSALLRRCLDHVLAQTFTDFEIVIIDDCSTDDTPAVVASYEDDRIRYIRNERNVGAAWGDRAHLRRFVHELARGEFWIYVCDDDYFARADLLQRQMEYFRKYPGLGMVIGGQLSHFIEPAGERIMFHNQVLPQEYMTSDEYLAAFSHDPIHANIVAGGTLYRRETFLRSGALTAEPGPQWQAGYELVMGPGCYGDVVYLNEPCVLTEIRPGNASFQRTQMEHYLDSVFSVFKAFEKPLKDWQDTPREEFLRECLKNTVEKISAAFLGNALHIKQHGSISMASQRHTSLPVTQGVVETVRALLAA